MNVRICRLELFLTMSVASLSFACLSLTYLELQFEDGARVGKMETALEKWKQKEVKICKQLL